MSLRTACFSVVLLGSGLAAAAVPALEPVHDGDVATPADWRVSIEAPGLAVEESAVRAAVERELLRAGVPAGKQPIQVRISVVPGGSLSVRYRNPDGAELSRSVTAPARADEVPEASALLVSNLARDEASALLAGLEKEARTGAAAAAAPPAPGEGASSAAASPGTGTEPRELPPVLPLESMNLSLFHPLTLRSATERRHLACELGMFYSRSAAVTGVSLTFAGVSRVDGPASGLQLGGVGYWDGGPGTGVRIGGLFGVAAARFDGVSVAGVASIQRGELAGAQVSGLANITTGTVQGVQLATFVNTAGPLDGVQVAGLVNTAPSVSGAQIADIANVSSGRVDGTQLSAVANIGGDLQGLQVSLVNIGGSVEGAQIGLVNIAEDVEGVQIGLVNVARSVKGQSIGIVPYNREGGVKIASWYNTSEPFNVGLRFNAGALYVMPTFAFDPGSAVLITQSGARYSPGWSLGLRLPFDRAFLDLDTNYSQHGHGFTSLADPIELRYRALVGWQFLKGFAAFAGGGIRHHVSTNNLESNYVRPELSVGMELL